MKRGRMSPEEQRELDSELGYSESSERDLKVREWFSLREHDGGPREFARLVARLYQAKYRKERPADKLSANKKWIGKNLPHVRAYYSDRSAGRARRAVFTCAARDCDVRWCRVPKQKVAIKYCSNDCERRERNRRYWHDRKPANSVPPRPVKTHCPHGHPYDADNTYINKAGTRTCRACRKYTPSRRAKRSGRRGPMSAAGRRAAPPNTEQGSDRG